MLRQLSICLWPTPQSREESYCKFHKLSCIHISTPTQNLPVLLQTLLICPHSDALKRPDCRVPWSSFCTDPWSAAEELHDRGCIKRSKSYLYFHMIDQVHCLTTAAGEWAVDFVGRVDGPNEDWAEVRAVAHSLQGFGGREVLSRQAGGFFCSRSSLTSEGFGGGGAPVLFACRNTANQRLRQGPPLTCSWIKSGHGVYGLFALSGSCSIAANDKSPQTFDLIRPCGVAAIIAWRCR